MKGRDGEMGELPQSSAGRSWQERVQIEEIANHFLFVEAASNLACLL